MATITRTNLFQAIEEASSDFISDETFDRLKSWAYDAESFTVCDWDGCPLDQVGLVKKFENRGRYDTNEDVRFKDEANELDARILNHIQTDLVGVLDVGLKVYVTG